MNPDQATLGSSPAPNPPGPRSGARWVVAAVLAAGLLGLAGWWFLSPAPQIIKLSAAEAPARTGWQITKHPFWVKAEALAALRAEDQWQGQYVIVVFKDGRPYYQRSIDARQIQSGTPFDLAVEKNSTPYTAAFVRVEGGKPGRRLSNTLSFTH